MAEQTDGRSRQLALLNRASGALDHYLEDLKTRGKTVLTDAGPADPSQGYLIRDINFLGSSVMGHFAKVRMRVWMMDIPVREERYPGTKDTAVFVFTVRESRVTQEPD